MTKPNPENCKNCSSKCVYDCVQLSYTIQHRTVLIILILTSSYQKTIVSIRPGCCSWRYVGSWWSVKSNLHDDDGQSVACNHPWRTRDIARTYVISLSLKLPGMVRNSTSQLDCVASNGLPSGRREGVSHAAALFTVATPRRTRTVPYRTAVAERACALAGKRLRCCCSSAFLVMIYTRLEVAASLSGGRTIRQTAFRYSPVRRRTRA